MIACVACSASTSRRVVESPPPVAPVAPVAIAPPAAAPSGPPIARTDDTVDRVFGLAVPDPYRWMETRGDERDAWMRAQGEHAAETLAMLLGRDALYRRVKELGSSLTAVWSIRLDSDRLIYSKLPAGAQLAKLVTRDRGGGERVLVDPEQLGTAERHASLNAYSLSPDGKRVAYVVAMGGGEVGELHVMDVATGKDLPDVIPRIWGEGSASWLPDGKRFFYTQMAVPGPGV